VSREDWKPWARPLPTWLVRVLLVLMAPFYCVVAVWDGGIKELLRELRDGWREATTPRSPASTTGKTP
jgi:hypothetical protein